jgi:hypothetical protein
MKKLIAVFATIFFLTSVSLFQISAFAGERDTSTVEKALLGHWRADSGEHFYITEGKFVQVKMDGTRTPFSYVTFSANDREGILEIQANRPGLQVYYRKLEFRGTNDIFNSIKIRVTEKYVSTGRWFYVDDQREP